MRKAPSRNPVVWLTRLMTRLFWGSGWRVTALSIVLIGGAVLFYAATLPPVTSLLDGRARGSVTLLDRNGQIFAWRGEQFGGQITAQSASPYLKDAILATEDKRFYRHRGVDLRAMLRALGQALWHGEVISGGSTLTMQVARLLEDSGTGRMRGKLRQIRVALALERRLSKADILALYLHLAPYGGNIEGVRAASLAWFGKDPARLTPAQAALLVALPQAPEARRPD